jgi:hypothetical protein
MSVKAGEGHYVGSEYGAEGDRHKLRLEVVSLVTPITGIVMGT